MMRWAYGGFVCLLVSCGGEPPMSACALGVFPYEGGPGGCVCPPETSPSADLTFFASARDPLAGATIRLCVADEPEDVFSCTG